MRIILMTHPGYGHFHPLVPLGQALQAAGHEVLVAGHSPADARRQLPPAAQGAGHAAGGPGARGAAQPGLPLASNGALTVRELPGAEVIALEPHGDPYELNAQLGALRRLAEQPGYDLAGSLRLVYLRGVVEQRPVEEWLFEAPYPLVRARAPLAAPSLS